MNPTPTAFGVAIVLALAWPSGATETSPARRPVASGVEAAQKPEAPDEPEVPRLHEEITVTASKTPQPRKDVTQTVRVIDAEEIAQMPFGPNRNLSELLSYQPGIFVSALSRNDANWGSNGGMGPKYSSYLLEGLPIDAFVDGMSLDPAAFQRVEVQRGPAAVMYSNYLGMDFAGNQTPLAGITNYVLRDRVDAPLTRIQAGFGSWATANAQAYHQGRASDFHYFMGGSWERSDYTNYGTPGSWLNILDDPQYTKVKLYGKGTLFFGKDQSLSLFAHYTGQTGDVGRPNRDFDHAYGTINAAYQGRISEALDLQGKAGARLYGRRWGEDLYPASLALREHDGVDQTVFPADVSFTWRQKGESRLTFGGDAQYATYETYAETDAPRTTGNDATASSAGLFAQEQLVARRPRSPRRPALWPQPAVVHSARRCRPRRTREVVGQAAVEHGHPLERPPVGGRLRERGLELRGPDSQGGGRHAPGRRPRGPGPERPAAQPGPSARERHRGRPRPRSLGSTTRSRSNVRGFLNRIEDVIVDNVVSQNPSQTRSVNAGDATSYGVEVALDQALSRSFRLVRQRHLHPLAHPEPHRSDAGWRRDPVRPRLDGEHRGHPRPAPRVHHLALPARGGHLLRQHVPERPPVVRRVRRAGAATAGGGGGRGKERGRVRARPQQPRR